MPLPLPLRAASSAPCAASRPSDGAGVKLTRVIGQRALDMLDPFLMLDEFRSDSASATTSAASRIIRTAASRRSPTCSPGACATATTRATAGLLTPGSVQWMTAGRGIVHSEMPEQEDGLMWGFQLWVNLPAKDKMTAPRYQDIAPERIPEATPASGVRVRVLAGRIGDVERSGRRHRGRAGLLRHRARTRRAFRGAASAGTQRVRVCLRRRCRIGSGRCVAAHRSAASSRCSTATAATCCCRRARSPRG